MSKEFLRSVCFLILLSTTTVFAGNATLNIHQIEQLTGAKATVDQKSQVVSVELPHTPIISQGVQITPEMEIDSTANFLPAGKEVMMMAEVILEEDQVNPAIKIALDNNLNVTALHNHFLWEKPHVMYLHLDGMGKEDQLATAMGQIFKLIKEKSSQQNIDYQIQPANTTLNPKAIDTIFAKTGQLKSGVYKIKFPRTTKMHGMLVDGSMDVYSWVSFAGSDQKAVSYGEIVTTENELQNVLRTLVKANINITAIHNHMTFENPRLIFVHYWAVGAVDQLAKGLKSALDQTKALQQ